MTLERPWMMLSPEEKKGRIDRRIVGIYLANTELLGTDFQLVSGYTPYRLEGRQSAIDQLNRILDRTPRSYYPPEDAEFIEARLNSTIAYLEQQGDRTRKPVPLYIAQALGIREEDIKTIPEPEMTQFRQSYHEALGALGYSPTEESIKAYREAYRHRDSWDIRQSIEVHGRNAAEQTQQFLGIDPKYELRFGVVTEEKDEYYKCWSSRDEDGFYLTINLHERHSPNWHKGYTEILGDHEIGGHSLEGYMMRDAYRRGLTSVARSGFTVIPGPENILGEGKAGSGHVWVPNLELSPEAVIADSERSLKLHVYRNAQLWLEEQGMVGWFRDNSDFIKAADEIELLQQLPVVLRRYTDYVKSNLPGERVKETLLELNERLTNPQKAAYRFAYSIGDYESREAASKLGEESKKRVYLAISQKPHTLDQFRELVAQESNHAVGNPS